LQIDTIVTDLDDTLLNETRQLSPYTLEVIAKLTQKGIRFIAASGRAAASMRPYVNQMNTGLPYIACNGAQLMNPDHTEIVSHMFTPAEAQALVRYFQAKGHYVQYYRGDYFYYAEETQTNRHYSTQTGMPGKAVGDLIAYLDFPTPKVLCVSNPEAVVALYPVIQADFPDVSFTISKPHFLEAQPKGVTKGAALQQLSGILDFSPEQTMVFGDSLNDIEMLSFAAHSVAIANARDEVKRIARYVTPLPNTQDGLAHFVEDKLLS